MVLAAPVGARYTGWGTFALLTVTRDIAAVKGYDPGVLDLCGVTEIAELLGVSRQRADQLSRYKGFPEPAATLSNGRIWLRSDVEAWAREVGRLNKGDKP
ncbi:MAG: hypothetical protein JWM85_435, partial [Acidimicrobiaceae bacterium]|nr:hypothetical protein [Acidimicrobiaceae bacterium]